MIISIWVLLILIVTVAFWFFYKKNKFKLKKPVVKTIIKETKYTLTNIDKMLSNVTQKEVVDEEILAHSDKQGQMLGKDDKETLENATFKDEKKQGFDFKSGIITSVLLKKKEDL